MADIEPITVPETPVAKTAPDRSWVPYVVPMVAFLLITQVEGMNLALYPMLYIAKVIIVGILLVMFKSNWKDYKFDKAMLGPGVVVGIIGFVLWVGIQESTKYPMLMERTAFDPMKQIDSDGMRSLFLGFRFFGLVLLVPFMEELFWRAFGLRYATDKEWNKLPLTGFTFQAVLITSAVFAAAHPEWVPAVIFSFLMAALLKQTKSVFACFVAHLVTNLLLGVYVLHFQAWKYW